MTKRKPTKRKSVKAVKVTQKRVSKKFALKVLEQMDIHAPLWASILRRYINQMEVPHAKRG